MFTLTGDYILEQLSGSSIPQTYSGETQVYKITYLPSGKWTHFIVFSGDRVSFINQRSYNMFQDHSADTSLGLAASSFDTVSGATATRYMVQVPIDWVLLTHEANNMTYVLDFDDPSGLKNMMSMQDIETLLTYLEIL